MERRGIFRVTMLVSIVLGQCGAASLLSLFSGRSCGPLEICFDVRPQILIVFLIVEFTTSTSTASRKYREWHKCVLLYCQLFLLLGTANQCCLTLHYGPSMRADAPSLARAGVWPQYGESTGRQCTELLGNWNQCCRQSFNLIMAPKLFFFSCGHIYYYHRNVGKFVTLSSNLSSPLVRYEVLIMEFCGKKEALHSQPSLKSVLRRDRVKPDQICLHLTWSGCQ